MSTALKKTEGQILLSAWLFKNNLTYRAAGKLIGVTAQSVYQWDHGKITPSIALGVMLEKITQIPLHAWVRNTHVAQ